MTGRGWLSPRVVLVFGLYLVGGCRNMVQQARYDSYEASPLYPNGSAMQPPPEGTVAQDQAAAGIAPQRPALTAALIARGHERYAIYCTPCHAADGSGEGIVPARGFPRPPDLRTAGLPAARVYDVIARGSGTMYAFADRVAPRDRWAIAAYVAVLQHAQPGAKP